MPPARGNRLLLGHAVEANGAPVRLPPGERDKHLYVCGGTGMGKSKFLEHLIRQDILNWRGSRAGLMVLDPHGKLYDDLMAWLAWNRIDRPVIPIDLRQDEWVIAYNLLRKRQAAQAVVVDNMVQAMAHVWGQAGTDQTPLFAKWAGILMHTLYENECSLVEAEYLIDRTDSAWRTAMSRKLERERFRKLWEFVDGLRASEFDVQIGSTDNRLNRFIENPNIRAMFGQTDVSLDLGAALEEGHIILVSLSQEKGLASAENARLFATLLLTDLWTAAQERGKPRGAAPKPFYVYIDEFQRFLSPTIAENLDEARGFGLHLTLAHQFPGQLVDSGLIGKRLMGSVMNNASTKAVLRLQSREDLEPLASWLFTGVMDVDAVKHAIYSTKVMDYRMEEVTSVSRSSSRSAGGGTARGISTGSSFSETSGIFGPGGTGIFGDGLAGGSGTVSEGEGRTESSGESRSDSESWSESEGYSESVTPTLRPVMGKELSSVQYRTPEEQMFQAVQRIYSLPPREAYVRSGADLAPVRISTPTVRESPASERLVREYREMIMGKWSFAMPGAEARRRLEERERYFKREYLLQAAESPVVDEPRKKARRVRRKG